MIIFLLIIWGFLFGNVDYTYPYLQQRSDTIPVLIPKPYSITWMSDSCFFINESTVIALSNRTDTTAAHCLQQEIIKSCACTLQVVNTLVSSNSIVLRRRGDWREILQWTQQPSRPQAYLLRINCDYCVITGDDADGLFYGTMTLKQLIAQNEGNYLTGVRIYDHPNLYFRGTRMAYTGSSTWLDSMKRRADYFASLKLNKLILESWDLWKSDYAYVGVIDTFFNWCRRSHIEPIPLLQSFGHAGNILRQNPACGEAVYREDEHFYFLSDTAKCLDDTTIFKRPLLVDIGFDSVSGNVFTMWNQHDRGITIFSDASSCRAGKSCVKIKRLSYGTSRLWQDLECNSNTLYTLSFFIKTQSVSGSDAIYGSDPVGFYIEIYGYDKPRGWVLLKRSRVIRDTQDWQKVSLVFNSDDYRNLRVYVGLYNAKGTVWIDGERLPVIMNAGFEKVSPQGIGWTQRGGGNVKYLEGAGYNSRYSCMIERIRHGYTRVYQDIEVEPGYDYRLKAWVKTHDIKNGNCFCTAFWVSGDTSQYWQDPGGYHEFKGILMSDTVGGTSNWTEISTNWFSSAHCKKIRIKLVLEGIGTAYFDSVVVEKVDRSLVNVDTTTPIKITNETGIQYQLGTDYQIILGTDLKFPYNLNADPSIIIRTDNSAITDSQLVFVNYDKLPAFQLKKDKGNYPYCPTKLATWRLMDSTIVNVLQQWDPQTIHFGHDEISFMKTDQPCLQSGHSRAGLLASNINTLRDKINPRKMMIWGDMLNPYHLGRLHPDDPTYYAADSIYKDIIPVIWFYKGNEPFSRGNASIDYFGGKGFRTIAACAGYDPLNVYHWASEIKHHWIDLCDSSCYGLLNTVWGSYADFQNKNWNSLPITLEYSWQWPDSSRGRVWGSLRYDPLTLHRNYGDIFVPRPVGLGLDHLDSGTIRVFWKANRNLDLKKYNLYRDSLLITTTVDTFYIDSILPGIHCYRVTAVDELDNESPYSRECILSH